MNTRKFISMLSIAGLFVASCSDDDDAPTPVNDEEVITTMTVSLTAAGEDTVTLSFFDEDGADGPSAPVPTISGPLSASTTYTGAITVLNATENPPELVNEEIEGEADEHQFFYITDDLGITTTYTDQECDYTDDPCEGSFTNPVGLTFELTTTATTGAAQLRFVLRHQLNKEAQGVADGDIVNAGGSPDIDYVFNIRVE